MIKKKLILTVAGAALVLLAGFLFCRLIAPETFSVGDNEIALNIQLDTKEDIGLLVFDYTVNGAEFSGGISNADMSLLKHNEQVIETWNQETLNCYEDPIALTFRFRIITEYVDPNFENIYPEKLTKYMEPVFFEAHWGEIYNFTITGDRECGYKIVQDLQVLGDTQ